MLYAEVARDWTPNGSEEIGQSFQILKITNTCVDTFNRFEFSQGCDYLIFGFLRILPRSFSAFNAKIF